MCSPPEGERKVNIHGFRRSIHRALSGLALSTGLAACAPEFPPIVAGSAGDHVFKARIAQAYPPGSRAAAMRSELIREGFTLYDDRALRRHSAIYRAENLPCFSSVRIDWTEDRRGRIAEIQAQRADCT